MVVSILHRGLESPEILWRRKLRADSIKLGAELRDWHPDAGILERIAAGIIRPHEKRHFERVMLRGRMREELTKSFRDGFLLAQMGPISAITNYTSSVTYPTIKDAIYLASSGDEIILPAGSGATYSGTFTRYSNFGQLNSYPGYSDDSSDVMVFGYPAKTANPSLYAATYLSIIGIASTNTLSSVSWANTSGGQLTVVISGSLVTTYRRGQYIRISGATNTGTGGAVPGVVGSINNTFYVLSVSGSTLVLNAPASTGVYGTIGGAPVLNNDRAQISAPVGYLAATLNPGDTTIQLDDAADFTPSGNPSGSSVIPWGNGDGTWQSVGMGYTGVSGNNLTGVTGSSGLPTAVPVGNPIMASVPGNKALFTPAATNAIGITMSNLELWGAAAYPSGSGIFQWVNTTIGGAIGNLTLNNLFFHDNMMGIRPGNSSVGSGVFLDIYNSEFWRNGLYADGFNHNLYVEADILTMQNCLSWQDTTLATGVSGAHLVKSRSRVNYLLQNRTFSDHGTTANPGNTWSSNYDFPNGGEIYLIGCELANSLHDTTQLIRWQEEMQYPPSGIGGNSNNGAANPISALYVVNCDGLAPSNGIGINETNYAPIAVGWPGLKNPEIPSPTTTSGGSLPARSYWFATTCLDSGGNESLPSCMVGNNAFVLGVTPQISVGANNLAVLASPITRTGAVNYNVYAAHADPVIWWNSGNAPPPATGPNQFYWDSGFTEPVFVVNAGGSQPAAFIYAGVTYVFSEGESVNFATGGSFFNLLTSSSPVQVSAGVINVPANNLLTIKSPPAMAGATGWYPNISIVPYNVGFSGPVGLSPQVDTPIAIGTDWVQSGAFRMAETLIYNFYKQNSSPITMGTSWTEPTTGLTNLNPNLLKWRRIGHYDTLGFSRWYAKATTGYSGYVANAYDNNRDGYYGSAPIAASIRVWTGTASPWPFDADYPAATLTTAATSTTATTAAATTVVEAAFRINSTAGSGWTQLAATSILMSEYQSFSSPQTSVAVTQTGGGSTSILVNAITGTSLTLRGSPQSVDQGRTSNAVSFTIPTIVSGDYLVMDVAVGSGPQLLAIDPLAWGPPAQNQALANSPVGLVINNAFAYYATATTGGYIQTYPGVTLFAGVGYPTVSSYNLQVNAYNGSGFNAPLVGAVWNGAPNFDFTLAGGSPLIGAGTNPGSGGGFSLVPAYQTPMNGPPTPGFPIASLTSRTDNGVTLGALQSGAPVPSLRLRWMRFGWDWKTIVTLGAAVLIENPTVSRRNVLLLQQQDGGASGENAAAPRPHKQRNCRE